MIRNLFKNLPVAAILATFYLFLRYPLSHIELPFYDDGETLYHVLSIIKGGVPYRDDYTHHFLGYLIPYLLISKVVGYSLQLVPLLAAITQSLTGLGVFLILKRFVSPYMALLGGLLALSAREPWVLGFFIQYQHNLFLVFSWYLLIRYLNEGNILFLLLASFLVGMLLISDQRNIFASLLPFVAVFLRKENIITRSVLSIATILIPIGYAVNYLWQNGALMYFFEQTIYFPFIYRSGSKLPSHFLSDLYVIHRYLWQDTFVIFAFGIFGGFVLWSSLFKFGFRGASFFLLLAGLVQATIPLLGGRDYDYYTIPWIPWLAIMSIIGGDFLINRFRIVRWPVLTILLLPLAISIMGWRLLMNDSAIREYRGDGIGEVVQKLESYALQGSRIFLWGYRLDLYARLKIRSAYPFANNLSVHPDPQIRDSLEREKHVSPAYLAYFFDLLKNSPPDILVFFTLNNQLFTSKADAYLRELRDKKYDYLFEVNGKNFRDEEIKFVAYKLKS